MCGRYTLTTPAGMGLPDRFGVPDDPEEATLERYNVCPTEQIAVVSRKEGERQMRSVRWGLVPSWAKELGKGREPINARSETVAETKTFAGLYARADRRCLVLADGWYEWLRSENPKQPRIPFRYTVDGGEPFAFAGLFGYAKLGEDWITSATILTTRANGVCAPVHDRMPVVLAGPDEEAAWLEGVDDPELFLPLADARTIARPGQPGGQPRGSGGAGADRAAAAGAGARPAAAAAVRNASNRRRPIAIHSGSRSAASAMCASGSKSMAIASGSLSKSCAQNSTMSGVTSGWNCTAHAASPIRNACEQISLRASSVAPAGSSNVYECHS